jgi:hypothetical protein
VAEFLLIAAKHEDNTYERDGKITIHFVRLVEYSTPKWVYFLEHFGPHLLQSTVTMPTKDFFSLLLTPTCSSHYPFLYTTWKPPFSSYVTGTSLNCQPQNSRPGDSTSTSLNCNFAQTPHDMPSSLDGGLGHLGHLGLLGQWPDNMPSSCTDSLDPFGHLSHLGLLGHLGYLNVLDPKPNES